MENLKILTSVELESIEGGSEFSENFFYTVGWILGTVEGSLRAVKATGNRPYFGNAMYYK